MVSSDWIALISLIIATAAFLYAWVTNTKKYELTDLYRRNVLDWYENTVHMLINLKLNCSSRCLCEEKKMNTFHLYLKVLK